MSLWKGLMSLCMVCLFDLLVVFFYYFVLALLVECVSECLLLYLLLFLRTVFSLYQSVNLQRGIFLNTSLF